MSAESRWPASLVGNIFIIKQEGLRLVGKDFNDVEGSFPMFLSLGAMPKDMLYIIFDFIVRAMFVTEAVGGYGVPEIVTYPSSVEATFGSEGNTSEDFVRFSIEGSCPW